MTLESEQRVLIELSARPTRDRLRPGNSAEVHRQIDDLERSLAALDVESEASTKSRVSHRFVTLFGGVAAVVPAKVLASIRRLPNVKKVHRDLEVKAELTESVPLTGAPTVWSTYSVTGTGVKVAVIDTGIDYTHPDLGGCFGVGCRVTGGYDFVNADTDPNDDNGHGTHVAGIIAANGTLKGVAPGATLLAYKVLDASGFGWSSAVIAALELALTDGAKVANLSLGGSGNPDDPVSQAVDNATAAGMLSVVAAGNSGSAYHTVASPGVARTALTVGAINKSNTLASFSSRGDVAAGEEHYMKPDIVAPGVDIRSTVPAAGIRGDPSRYKALSGTSMAAPHVAAAAALLLQWKSALSAADLRNRLIASAKASSNDLFAEGAGRLDLVAAFGLTVAPSVAHLPFGIISNGSGVSVIQKTLVVQNISATLQSLALTSGSPALPAGATLDISPTSVSLQAGESVEITLRLEVDSSVTPEPPDPMGWSTRLLITAGGKTARVPLYFFRGAVVSLEFDGELDILVLLVPDQNVYRSLLWPDSKSFSFLLPACTLDVFAEFRREYEQPVAIVVREQIVVQDRVALTIEKKEATRSLTVRPVDENGDPILDSEGMHESNVSLKDSSNPTTAYFSLLSSTYGRFPDYRVSPVSSRYVVGAIGGAPASNSRYYVYSWSGAGFPADVILPVDGVPMRVLEQGAQSMPDALMTHSVGMAVRMKFFTVGMGTSSQDFQALFGAGWTFHRQTTSASGAPIILGDQMRLVRYGSGTDSILGSYIRYDGGTDLAIFRSPFFGLSDASQEPDVVLGASVQRWDIDAAPPVLSIDIIGNPGSVYFAHDTYPGPRWRTGSLSILSSVAGVEPEFTLYRSDALVGTYRFSQLSGSIPSPSGPHQVRSSQPYKIGTVSAVSNFTATFDSSHADPSPPRLSQFRIEQNGQPTARPIEPWLSGDTQVLFRAGDRQSLASVALEWRPNGTTDWNAMTLTESAGEYSAPFEMQGTVDLRVTATDAGGNSTQEEWIPAVITALPPPPSTPASVTAVPAGRSARISWIAVPTATEYRVERYPDGLTFTAGADATSYVDANGLTSGGAYAYRVAAVGSGGTSAPSAYDVVVLVPFEDDPLIAGETLIRSVHILDLRDAIDALRRATGLEEAWPDHAPATGLVTSADVAELRGRLDEARSILQLSPVEGFAPATLTSIRATDLQVLRDSLH